MTLINVAKDQATEFLIERMRAGQNVVDAAVQVRDRSAFDDWRRQQRHWTDVTMDALKHIYTTETESDAFALAASHKTFIAGGDWPDWLEDDVSDVKDGISKLNALSSGLRFATESATAMSEIDSTSPGNVSAAGSGVVFLVHGRDTAARETVARFLESAGNQRLVILHEQPNRGQTLIEKFEKHATSAKYAVVLLTADDEGAGQGDVPRPRARQNVVFELGFFFGRLGRDRVAVLYESDVELPSDVDGLAYISLAKNWQAELVRDLRDAGLDFSLDRALNASDE